MNRTVYIPKGSPPDDPRLDRLVPGDWKHVDKYPLTATARGVERLLPLPRWHWTHDQGQEGACTGHGSAMMMTILNSRRYDPFELYHAAQKIDEWPGEDYSGSSVRANMDILRDRGPCSWRGGKTGPPNPSAGINANRWATTVDQIRGAIAEGVPVTIGVNWYEGADSPQKVGSEWWILRENFGALRGGHAVCLYGASDRRGAFKMKNSWGKGYPLVWLPYNSMQRLLDEEGEATVVADR